MLAAALALAGGAHATLAYLAHAIMAAQAASSHLGGALASLPLALDGEAEGSGNVGLGVISVVSIVAGYVGLFALWWFVFRDRSRSRRKKDPSDR
jgi:hypothetical protein